MLIKINVENVFAIGDIHGNFNGITGHILRYGLHDCAIIFCGDISFGFYKEEYYKQTYDKLKKVCCKYNVHLFFIRGNHDDPSYFNEHKINFPYFTAVSDYTVIETYNITDTEYNGECTHRILCIGGATSIDRQDRLNRMQKRIIDYKRWHAVSDEEAWDNISKEYWKNEQPFYDSEELENMQNIDCVCTHTCPSFCQPLTKDGIQEWAKYDEKLFDDIDNERKIMDEIYNHLIRNNNPITLWVYGHYHYHNMEYINNIKFVMLDMCRDFTYDMIEIR